VLVGVILVSRAFAEEHERRGTASSGRNIPESEEMSQFDLHRDPWRRNPPNFLANRRRSWPPSSRCYDMDLALNRLSSFFQ
jgi:hypothetical protein